VSEPVDEPVGGTGRYLYAVSRGLDPAALEGVRGLDGGRLELVPQDELVAVVSDVDLAEYGEHGLRRNLEDLAWLEVVARAHDAVVNAAAMAAPTAPLRLATICLDDDGVRRRLGEWHEALVRVLDRIEGRYEFSVKLVALQAAAEPPAPVAATTASGPGAGAAYLQRKRDQTQARVEDERQAVALAADAHARLAGRSVAERQLPAQDPRLTGLEGTMLLNGAYLVEADDVAAFTALAEQLATELAPGVGVEWRGPWPPYSFAMLDQR
jgi:hypothetical protein